MVSKTTLNKWAEQRPCVKKWRDKLKADTTKTNHVRILYHFIEYLEQLGGFKWTDEQKKEHIYKTPKELLDAQDELQNKGRKERYLLLDAIQRFINLKKERYKTKQLKYSAIKSFFLHNRSPLPKDATFSVTGDAPPTQGFLQLDDLKKIILSSNEAYQSVFLIMFQGALGGAEFEYFNENSWKQIKPQLEDPSAKIIRIDIPGRKHARFERPFYTFIGKDAIASLRRYLKGREPIKNGEAIFISKNGVPINKDTIARYFQRHASKLGLIDFITPECPECHEETIKKQVSTGTKFYKKHKRRTKYICIKCKLAFPTNEEIQNSLRNARYGISPHEIRDLFRSCWETTPAKPSVAEFMMGHVIDPNNYNKFFMTDYSWVKKEYLTAMPWLNILSEDPRVISVDELSEITSKTEEQDTLIQQQQDEINSLKSEIAILYTRFIAGDMATAFPDDKEAIASSEKFIQILKKRIKDEIKAELKHLE